MEPVVLHAFAMQSVNEATAGQLWKPQKMELVQLSGKNMVVMDDGEPHGSWCFPNPDELVVIFHWKGGSNTKVAVFKEAECKIFVQTHCEHQYKNVLVRLAS